MESEKRSKQTNKQNGNRLIDTESKLVIARVRVRQEIDGSQAGQLESVLCGQIGQAEDNSRCREEPCPDKR